MTSPSLSRSFLQILIAFARVANWLMPSQLIQLCCAGEEEIPSWLQYTQEELAQVVQATSKQRPNQAKELAALAGILPKARPCCPAALIPSSLH